MTTKHGFFCLALLAFSSLLSHAEYPPLRFGQIVNGADLVFVGTVVRQECRFNDAGKFIVTDIYFSDVTVIHAAPGSRQAGLPTIRLTQAGGEVGTLGVSVSGVPRFETGRRYVVFTQDDGEEYASPLIGGPQGKFEVVRDSPKGRSLVLSSGGRGVNGLEGGELRLGARRLDLIGGAGSAPFSSSAPHRSASLPVPAGAGDSVHAASYLTDRGPEVEPVTLETFVGFIRQALTGAAPRIPAPPAKGLWWEREGDVMVSRELPERSFSSSGRMPVIQPGVTAYPSVPGRTATTARRNTTTASPTAPLGDILTPCGSQDLRIDMEQVSTANMSYTPNNESMWIWNRFMDLFSFTPDDGTYGAYPWNMQNEFVGFITDADAHEMYDFTWGDAIGMTATWYVPQYRCQSILQSDVMLNAATSWTNDENFSYTGGAYLIRPVIMHELGHAWGLALGYEEHYDYDVPTVMHAIGGVIENGWGIHAADAYWARVNYKDQTPVINLVDVGVESYYAAAGLVNSKPNFQDVYWGFSVTLKNVTVENMSIADVSDVRLRFYLSTDRTITTSDYQLGTHWVWSVFPAETHVVADYTFDLPSIPPGEYYIGAIVTVNGFATDDFPQNNATSFYGKFRVRTAPELAISTAAIDLGSRYASSAFSTGFNITNRGQATLTGSITDSADWITSLAPTGFLILPSQTVTASIQGSYPATAGTFTTNVEVRSNGGNAMVSVTGISVVDPPGFTRVLTGPVATDRLTSVGCAWGDYDGDGDDDLYVTNNSASNSLYRNAGAGLFEKVFSGPPVNDGGNSDAASWGDYDNDGLPDLLVAHSGGQLSRLYHNDGGGVFSVVPSPKFAPETADARGCSWVDFNNDGQLDAFIATYGASQLHRNNGDGTFTRVTAGPLVTAQIAARNGAWCDYDNDGDQDLYITSYYGSGGLFANNGNGTFTQVTTGPILTDSIYACGASWGDYDNDGWMDLLVTHTNRMKNALFHNQGGGTFTRVTTGVIAQDSLFSEGSCWLDYNNDGYLDLFVARGGPFTYSEVLYQGNGDGTFAKVTGPAGEFSDRGMSFGCATADADNDGDADLVVVNASAPFVNYQYANNGAASHWVKIRCVGYTSNRSAIGARVTVKTRIRGAMTLQTREISGQSGYGGQNSLIAHFGLGDATVIDTIRVRWPSGRTQVLTGQGVDRLLTIEESPAYPAPAQVTVLNSYPGQVPMAWKAPGGAAGQSVQSYTLRRYAPGGALDRTFENIPTTYFRDETPAPGQTYTYQLGAVYSATDVGWTGTIGVSVASSGYAVQAGGAAGIPVLDGFIASGEWVDAATVDVTVPGSPTRATLYVKSAANMLFFALDNLRDASLDTNDMFGVFIDGDANRGWPDSPPSREGLLQIYQSAGARTGVSAFQGVRGVWPAAIATDPWVTPPGVRQKISTASGHVQYEASVHLNAGPLQIDPAGKFGAVVYSYDNGGRLFTAAWPQDAAIKLSLFAGGSMWAYAPFTYGDVTLGSSSTVGVEVTFSLTVPTGIPADDTVYVTGDFNMWDPGPETAAGDGYHHDLPLARVAEREWRLTLPFARGDTIEYKFTRGSWGSVEKGSQGEELPNRMLVIPDTGLVRQEEVLRWADITVAVGRGGEVPCEFGLSQNYPNPFNPTTEIRYQVSGVSDVKLVVYDILGSEVATLVEGRKDPGRHEVTFDAAGLASGVYVYRLTAGNYVATRKMVVVK